MHIDDKLTLTELIRDGVVKACASVFPVQIWYHAEHPDGTSTNDKLTRRTRLIIAQHPDQAADNGGPQWVALAYMMPSTGGDPQLVHYGVVEEFLQLDARNIEYIVMNQNDDIIRYRAQPDGGCSCGARMKQWQPFAEHGAQLAAVGRPDIG